MLTLSIVYFVLLTVSSAKLTDDAADAGHQEMNSSSNNNNDEYTFINIVKRMLAIERALVQISYVDESAPVDGVLFKGFCNRDSLRNALKGCANFNVDSTDCVTDSGPVTSSTNYFCSDAAAYSTNGRLTLAQVVTQKCAFAIYSPGKRIELTCTQVPANYLRFSGLTPVTSQAAVVQNVKVTAMNSMYLDAPAAPVTAGPLECTWVSL